MKKSFLAFFAIIAILALSSSAVVAQKTFTWDSYVTQFTVPDDFRVTESTGDKWNGTNDNITMTIFPRKDENLSWEEMQKAVYDWTVESHVTDIGTAVDLDEDKLNGYWGVLYEGKKDGFPVATMLIVDPDYTEISLYIWVSYREGYEDDVLEMLMSFTPN